MSYNDFDPRTENYNLGKFYVHNSRDLGNVMLNIYHGNIPLP